MSLRMAQKLLSPLEVIKITFRSMSPDSKVKIALDVNGERTEVAFAPHKTLLEVLREDLGLTGTKHGCELGECGTCTVLLDGTPVLSCLVLGLACAGHGVRTVEAMATRKAFTADPDRVWRWYDERRTKVTQAPPNAAHEAVARIARNARECLVVTQNVDDLHLRAGTERRLGSG